MNKNLSVIGYGYWGKNLIRNFQELGVLHTICDSDLSRKELVAKNYPEVQFTNDYQTVLNNPEIDVIAISSPAVMHFQMVKQALEAGKDVFVEKPLALDVNDGQQLINIAEANDRILMVGHILRYHPAIRKLSELINQGDLGQIQYIYSNRLNIGKIRTEENILWSFAPHDISVILSLLGEEPTSISCHGNSWLNQDVFDVTNTNLKFPSGVSAHIFVSWLHPFKEQRLVVIGSEKMAVFDDTAANKLVLYPHKVEWKQRIPTAIKAEMDIIEIETYEPLKEELTHFIDCLKSRKQPITNGYEGLRVLKVLDACENSLSNNQEQSTKHQKSGSNLPNSQPLFYSHETSCIDSGCQIGEGTKIWHFSHIMEGAIIGNNCIIGQNCCVSPDVIIGSNVKIQNNVSVYTGTIIEDDVFLGPSCVLTNVSNPRSQINRHSLYEKTILKKGVTIGANSTIVCGIEIGNYAFISAGATVTKNVPGYALMMGTPAKQVGWMSRHGHRLSNPDSAGIMTCPESGLKYHEEESGIFKCLDLDDTEPLPENLSTGKQKYNNFKQTP